MHVVQRRFGVIIAASGLTCLCLALARGDEPVKPTASASEANPAVPAPGHSVHGEAFNDGPRHAAYLMPGMGKVHFPATTKKPEAQAFIDQGVAQLHSFYYFESERSFRQAAKIDPDCAMAYWGMAMSNVNNPKRAKGFLKEARKRAAQISHRESLYLDALEAFYKEGVNDRTRRQNWLQGLETIVQEFPGDIDARAWLAMVTWQNSSDGDRQPAGGRHRARHGASGRADASRAHTITASTSGTVSSRSAPRSRRRSTPRPRRGSRTPGTCPATPTPSSSGTPTPPTSRKARPASTTPT